jgi:hypothetical protein
MRRLVVIFGLTLVVSVTSGTARGDWQSMKAKWHCFWDRVHLDWHRNNAWPEPFVHVDRQATRAPIDVMVDKGWQLQNTISHQLFDQETQELTRAGELKVQWILTQMTPRRRTVFVMRGPTEAITQVRVQSVEKAAEQVAGDMAAHWIALTDIMPREGSGAYYERVNIGYESSTPVPRLPQVDGTTTGSN